MKRPGLIILSDIVSFWASFLIIIFIRFNSNTYKETLNTHTLPFAILCLSWIFIFFIFGLYDIFNIKPTITDLKRFSLALIVCFIVGIFFFYLIPLFGITPKTNLFFQVIGFATFSLIFRRGFYSLYSKQITRPGILVGKTLYLLELYNIIKANPQLGLCPLHHSGNLQESLERNNHLKNTVFIFEKNNDAIPENDILDLYRKKTEIIDIAMAYEKYLLKIPIDYISQSWIIENININGNFFYNIIRRILDIVFSIIILIIMFPLIIISSIFIYLYDRGPIFYIQERVGLHDKIFKLYKLRSMIINSERENIAWTTKNDSRITPIGKIIRKLHIDEVPQMINILKGDLTFVGPRPEWVKSVKIFENSIPHYRIRHVIRPGFTGWAQIKYRNSCGVEEAKEKFQYDLYYIKNRNIFLDFGIVLKTIQIIFTH